MRLVIAKYEDDEHGSMECSFCDDVAQPDHSTRAVFYEESNGGVVNVCSEHLDCMVSLALARHKEAMSKGDPFWYLKEDEDPWEGCQ